MYWFLSGFTAKLAGTEIGVKEPQPTFSACFGAPFLPQPPVVYARLLAKRLDEHGTQVWLVNTGWTGGQYGEGERMPITATRALLRAAIAGELDGVEYRTDDLFGFEVPVEFPTSTRSCSIPAAPGATPRPTTRRRASSPRCSATTSRSSTPTTTSSPAARASERGRQALRSPTARR